MGRASPVQIIEEGEQVEGEFAPGLLLAVVEDVGIHDGDCIIHDLRAIRRAVEVPGARKGPECPPSGSHPHLPCFPISPSPRQQLPSPPEVVEEEGDVEAQGHPLRCTQKHQTEEAVDGILWDHQLGSEGKRSVAWCQDKPKLQGHGGELGFGNCPPTMISGN